MPGYVWLFIAAIILYFVISRLVKFLIQQWLSVKFHLTVHIGKIGFLKLYNVSLLLRNDAKVEIDAVWISSSLVNANVSTLIALCVEEVRVQADLHNKQMRKKKKKVGTHEPDAMESKLVRAIVSMMPYMSIRISDVSVVLLRAVFQDCLLHSTVNEFSLSCTQEDSVLKLIIHIMTASTKVLRSVEKFQPGEQQPCIIDVTTNSTLHIHVGTRGGFSLLKLKLGVSKPQVLINEGCMSVVKVAPPQPEKEEQEDVEDTEAEHMTTNWKYFPEVTLLNVDGTRVAVLRESGQRLLSHVHACSYAGCSNVYRSVTLTIETIQFDSTLQPMLNPSQQSPAAQYDVIIKDVLVNATYVRLLSCNKFAVKGEVGRGHLQLLAQVSACHAHYHEDIIAYWSTVIPTLSPSRSQTSKHKMSRSLFWAAVRTWQVKVSAEMSDASLLTTFTGCPAAITSFTKAKLAWERQGIDEASTPPTYSDRLEGCIESLLMHTAGKPDCRVSDGTTTMWQHQWNTPLFLGICIFKLSKSDPVVSFHGTVDNLQLECCPPVLAIAKHIIQVVSKTRLGSDDKDVTLDTHMSTAAAQPKLTIGDFNMSFNYIYLFMTGSNKVCVMTTVNSLKVDQQDSKVFVAQEATRLYQFLQQGKMATVVSLDKLADHLCELPVIRLSYKSQTKDVNLQLLDDIHLCWNTNLHMSFISLAEELQEFITYAEGMFPREDETSLNAPSSKPASIHARLRGSICVELKLSSEHRVMALAGEVTLDWQLKQLTAKMGKLHIYCDDLAVFTLEDISLGSLHHSDQMRLERESCEDLQQRTNRAWSVTIATGQIVFPHGYNFAKTHQEAINIWKWLKLVHQMMPRPFTADSPLPADLLIRVRSFSVQVNDDPFEVKLRDNFELLIDEYMESEKRRQMLDSKIGELRKTHLLLPGGKVEELYEIPDEARTPRHRPACSNSREEGMEFTTTVVPRDNAASCHVAVPYSGIPPRPHASDTVRSHYENAHVRLAAPLGNNDSRKEDSQTLKFIHDLKLYIEHLQHMGTVACWTRVLSVATRHRQLIIQRSKADAEPSSGLLGHNRRLPGFTARLRSPMVNVGVANATRRENPTTRGGVGIGRGRVSCLDWTKGKWGAERTTGHLLGTDVEIRRLGRHAASSQPATHNAEWTSRAHRPFPEEGMEFTTLWCRVIRCSCHRWLFHLRDYPRPMLDISEMYVWGRLIGAEQDAAKRAIRECTVEVGAPWANMTVERKMPDLKFYHDLSCDIEHYNMAYGACWEPAFSQYNLATDLIIQRSTDPSPPLPYWDKQRLLLHGRLTVSMVTSAWLMHASRDPYNTAEEWDWTWSSLVLDWTNGKWVLKGDLDIYCRTESKYDDCRMLHLPNLTYTVNDTEAHHKKEEVAKEVQIHDSYRAFRSENLNISVGFETRPSAHHHSDKIPAGLWYASTLRWFDNLQTIQSEISRPIRRGKVFRNVRPPKKLLSRHYKHMTLLLNFHEFEVCYWTSFAKQCGIELRSSGGISLCTEYLQRLISYKDGLIQRPRLERNVVYMNCELNNAEIHLQSAAPSAKKEAEKNVSMRNPVNRNYFLSVARVAYGREAVVPDMSGTPQDDTPNHRLVVHHLMALWDIVNRNVVLALYDSYTKAEQLKYNLSADTLKILKVDTGMTPVKPRNHMSDVSSAATLHAAAVATPSPMSKLQSSHVSSMLQQLVSEADSKFFALHEEPTAGIVEQLQGVAACQTDDVTHKNWLIELINSQVMLKGCETSGYVIMSAAKTQILQRQHKPVWRHRQLYTKTTWVGSLDSMQYYATVYVDRSSTQDVRWLTVDNIDAKDTAPRDTVSDMVGSGQSVGGVITDTVGAASQKSKKEIQLQRVVSRCGCHFFYAHYAEHMNPDDLEEVPPPPSDELWNREEATDSFTLTHQELNICTNSLQYDMILDIINNLLLYVEPRKKEQFKKLQSMRFQLQLCSIEDQRSPILQIQTKVRQLQLRLRSLERQLYLLYRQQDGDSSSASALYRQQDSDHGNQSAMHWHQDGDSVSQSSLHSQQDTSSTSQSLLNQMSQLESQIDEYKESLNATNEELGIMISCFKESMLHSESKPKATKDPDKVSVRHRFEVCFKHAQWRLTDSDGQLGIADVALRNFLYTRTNKDNDSGEHLMELSYTKMTNLLPHSAYRDVAMPKDTSGKHLLLRIFCRDRQPVGGISIKEHFEVNVAPVSIQLTYQFFKTMMQFLFPGRNIEGSDDNLDGGSQPEVEKKKVMKRPLSSGRIESQDIDDIHKMRERAAKNNLFMYIKLTEVPMRVSYKGEKEKNIEDVNDFSIVMPTLEYHNQMWTWLDLVMAIKNDNKRALLSQAIKQKILKPSRVDDSQHGALQQETDKAKMLMGAKVLSSDKPSSKKSLFGKSSKQ
ncbi:PREDICTED: protein KIAA0100-like [Priapulus caudatus]|uniref:Protein KIAA0100-like n=1 Tax=Priapulus caudatus TaxID=37621 RepID=A0ABM1F1C8_PRICU|nr:PREDICTED: protein KIAA0100-like [Priapulus caudatus]